MSPSVAIRLAVTVLSLVLAGAASARQPSPAMPVSAARTLAFSGRADAPAAVSGTITYVDPGGAFVLVQDRTGGLLAMLAEASQDLVAGDVVTVDGRAFLSPRGPALGNAAVVRSGSGEAPEARILGGDVSRLPSLDGLRVVAHGVVRRVSPRGTLVVAAVATPAGILDVVLPRTARSATLDVDGVVTVTGVLTPRTGRPERIRDRELLVGPSPESLVVEEEPPADPYGAEPMAVADLPAAEGRGDTVRRVTVRGVVTRQRPGRSLYIQDPTGSLYVETSDAQAVSPGDEVEVLGFPAVDEYAPFLADATFRRTRGGPPPAPTRVTVAELLEGRYDAALVSVEAEFRGFETGREELTLVLEQAGVIFNAHVLLPAAGRMTEEVRPGDRVRVSGICSVVVDTDRQARSFRVMLRDSSDFEVVSRAAFVGASWMGGVGFAMALAAVGALGLAWRRILGQQATIRRQLAREASVKDRFDDLFERGSDIMVIHDRRGRVSTLNRAGEQASGYTREEMRVLDPSWAFSAEYIDQIQRMIAEGPDAPARAFRAEIVTRASQRLPIDVQARVLASDGQVTGVSAVARNLAEREQLEAQLRQAQKMEAVGRLATGIAHDFNNLITVLLGYSDELLELVEPGSDLRRPAEEIRRATERASGLTQQLLSFSRRHTTSPQSIDLNVAVANMQDMLRRLVGAEIRLDVRLQPDLGLVRADTAHIGQVVMNLAVNARDAMPEGGILTIETANVEIGAEDLDAIPGPHVMLAVSDSGHGMSPEVLRRLFEPFFTTKETGQGTGLGLSMVQGIVRQSGGHIRVDSEVGHGSTFRMYFPRVDKTAVALPEPPSRRAAAPPPVRDTGVVLFAEDDRAVRRLMTTELRRRGYTVLEARHGGEALEICRQYGADIDLLVTDVVMPQLNGADLANQVRPIRPEMAVLFISGHPERAGVGLDPSGPDAANLLMKPFTPETLSARVHEILRARRG